MGRESSKFYKEKQMSKELPSSDKISIVTVCYNAEEFIERTILSVIQQKYSNIEYIIIDGGSKDKTLEIIKKYENQVDFWMSEPDHGVFDAMNKGILNATGVWVNFMNAGDTFLSDDVLDSLPFAQSEGTAVLYGNRVVDYQTLTFPFPLKSIEYGMIPACHQAMFFNKKLIGKELYHSLKFSLFEEYGLVAKLFKSGYKFEYSDTNIVNYLSGGISNSISWEARKAKYYYLIKYFGVKGFLKGVGDRIGLLQLPKPIKKEKAYEK
jgi:glycosyltransferase involved in cell wall biosynthesis